MTLSNLLLLAKQSVRLIYNSTNCAPIRAKTVQEFTVLTSHILHRSLTDATPNYLVHYVQDKRG